MSQVTTLPMREDTRALIHVFVESFNNNVIRFNNGTGSAIDDRTFIVDSSGKWCGVIQGGPVANGDDGDLLVEEGIHVQSDDLTSGKDTFATIGQDVFFDSVNGEFADTWTAGYYLVGKLFAVKDSEGMIVFEKHRYAEVQNVLGSYIAPGEQGWIEFEITADATGAGLSNNFGFNFTVMDCFVECRAASGSGTITVNDSTPNAISSALVCAVDTTIGRTTVIDDAYATVADGILTFIANGAADRGLVRLLVQRGA